MRLFWPLHLLVAMLTIRLPPLEQVGTGIPGGRASPITFDTDWEKSAANAVPAQEMKILRRFCNLHRDAP